ncbi:hypothetical protein NC652_002263 [Populus alba x Populus x berolinensis]|nr:hypothetical protein NC652_002263 [Populus alba x Populus x berolinensis]
MASNQSEVRNQKVGIYFCICGLLPPFQFGLHPREIFLVSGPVEWQQLCHVRTCLAHRSTLVQQVENKHPALPGSGTQIYSGAVRNAPPQQHSSIQALDISKYRQYL